MFPSLLVSSFVSNPSRTATTTNPPTRLVAGSSLFSRTYTHTQAHARTPRPGLCIFPTRNFWCMDWNFEGKLCSEAANWRWSEPFSTSGTCVLCSLVLPVFCSYMIYIYLCSAWFTFWVAHQIQRFIYWLNMWIFVAWLLSIWCSGKKPDYLGVQKNQPALALCPATKNCISTSESVTDYIHYAPPW